MARSRRIATKKSKTGGSSTGACGAGKRGRSTSPPARSRASSEVFGATAPRRSKCPGPPPRMRLGRVETIADRLERIGMAMGYPEELVAEGMRLLRSGDLEGLREWYRRASAVSARMFPRPFRS